MLPQAVAEARLKSDRLEDLEEAKEYCRSDRSSGDGWDQEATGAGRSQDPVPNQGQPETSGEMETELPHIDSSSNWTNQQDQGTRNMVAAMRHLPGWPQEIWAAKTAEAAAQADAEAEALMVQSVEDMMLPWEKGVAAQEAKKAVDVLLGAEPGQSQQEEEGQLSTILEVDSEALEVEQEAVRLWMHEQSGHAFQGPVRIPRLMEGMPTQASPKPLQAAESEEPVVYGPVLLQTQSTRRLFQKAVLDFQLPPQESERRQMQRDQAAYDPHEGRDPPLPKPPNRNMMGPASAA